MREAVGWLMLTWYFACISRVVCAWVLPALSRALIRTLVGVWNSPRAPFRGGDDPGSGAKLIGPRGTLRGAYAIERCWFGGTFLFGGGASQPFESFFFSLCVTSVAFSYHV